MGVFFTEEDSVDAVNARIAETANPRIKRVMGSLIAHLHHFIKEVELTEDEWKTAINFLTRTGQISSDKRQEFILLSDALGISMLVDAVNHRRPDNATENTVFGPFHVENAPILPLGTNISLDSRGETCFFEGRVVDLQGKPIVGAIVDVWSDNDEGFYDVQQPGIQPEWNNRGRFITGEEGYYCFRGIKPVPYPIPDDGPVGDMLKALGRHPWRPAHTHFRVSADHYQRIVTHIFVEGSQYLDSDAVFGVKSSLIQHFEETPTGDTKWRTRFDFVMTPTEKETSFDANT